MEKAIKILIFTDLDGSLLHRDTFKFDEIKDYLIQLISKGIFIIPNTSKTEKEILQFNYELGSNLPFISENGAAINGLDLLNPNLPKELILSREKNDIFNIFKNIVPLNLQNKCKWLSEMNNTNQSLIFGLYDKKLKMALDRRYTIPFIFNGTKNEKNQLSKIIKKDGLSLQEGGRVINLTDKVNKAKALRVFVRFYKRYHQNVKTVAVGDNYNDLDMLKTSDFPCLVFNDKFILDEIPINNLITTNKPSPEGWADVIKMALVKINKN
ncbi:HAD-IIB family hydrolase [Candidatus Pelagibacter sp.]|uniref:HAD-IIB family hydrolase n=1 Tax=Candidatus Pelagibacter sp. TaxID=2024849 RepID=UPI003F862134